MAIWGVITLIGIFILALWSAIMIARNSNMAIGMIGGFMIGAGGWLIATFSFYYFTT